MSTGIFAQEPNVIHLAGGTYASEVSTDGGKLFVTSIPAVLISQDQGRSWQSFFIGIISDDVLLANNSMYASGTNYYTSRAMIVRIASDGSSWDTLFSSSTYGSHCSKISVSGNVMAALYKVPGQVDSVIYSGDSGKTWQALAIPCSDAFPYSTLVDVDFVGCKLVITDIDGLLMYENSNWSYVSTGIKAKDTYINGNTVMIAGVSDYRAAICKYYKDGAVNVDTFGSSGSQAYSVTVAGNNTYAIVRGQNGSSLQCKTGNGSWGTIAQYSFQLKSCRTIGNKIYCHGPQEIVIYDNTTTGVQSQGLEVPKEFKIDQNYPNPFNPSTRIGYHMLADAFVSIKVYDGASREIAVLVNEYKTAGHYTVEFDASKLTSGVYYYTFTAQNMTVTKKMVLVK